jgi:hypothetical protein
MQLRVKGKDHPVTGHQGPRGGSRGTALPSLDLGVRRGWVVTTTPRPLYPRERPGTHCTGSWVGPRAGLDVFTRHGVYQPPPFSAEVKQVVSSFLAWSTYKKLTMSVTCQIFPGTEMLFHGPGPDDLSCLISRYPNGRFRTL